MFRSLAVVLLSASLTNSVSANSAENPDNEDMSSENSLIYTLFDNTNIKSACLNFPLCSQGEGEEEEMARRALLEEIPNDSDERDEDTL